MLPFVAVESIIIGENPRPLPRPTDEVEKTPPTPATSYKDT